jgi:CheY-like chemotaxis protein/anti-sigma regulatory factor (Ser/Thr protein kinase)
MTSEPTGLRVVLVDDVEDVLRMVRTALRLRGGFDVVGQARSGLAAVDLVARMRPDVVVLDLGLPDLAGDEVLTRIREVSSTTQVVVLSGSAPDDRRWFEERTAGYVLKDQDLDYLLDLLENLGPVAGEARHLDLEGQPESAGRAREWLRGVLHEWGRDELVDEAVLVISELVGNAITHARSACHISVVRNGEAVRVEVSDHGVGTPQPRQLDDFAEGGRGLMMVGVVSNAWGFESIPDGKRVWAEIVPH